MSTVSPNMLTKWYKFGLHRPMYAGVTHTVVLLWTYTGALLDDVRGEERDGA